MQTNGEISLYFHIPFCTKKCPYCHFFVLRDDPQQKELYLNALKKEFQLRQNEIASNRVVSIYFGGGTPSLLSPEELSFISIPPNCEVTLEVNPENVTEEKMRAWREFGINRVSVGVQSLDPTLLSILGRGHGVNKAVEAVETIHRASIENISVDLMFDLPNQTLKSWEQTLDLIVKLPITHLSLYNLTIEPSTQFFKRERELRQKMPDETLSLQLLEMALAKLQGGAFERYEISAFARGQNRSLHNSGYWLGRPFLGLGPSAFSYWEGARFQNHCNLKRYADDLEEGKLPVGFHEKLEPLAHQKELLAIGLRYLDGVDLLVPDQTSIEKLIHEGLLQKKGGKLALTEAGTLLYDAIAEEIIDA